MFDNLKIKDPQVYNLILKEIERQNQTLELIASENFVDLSVLEAQGSPLTNKYAEGYPYARWYGGCKFIDGIEKIAIERAKKLFSAEHANVQPHSGTQANMAVYFSTLSPGDKILTMDLSCGGHLSHGHPKNFSGMFYEVISYGVNKDTNLIDYDEILKLAKKHKPKLILAGHSAYPREIDFKKFEEIAKEVGTYLFADIAHIAGLIIANIHPNPTPFAEFVTTTTHKTLRGARGGMILCKKEFAKKIDSMVFPGIQGGPLLHIISAKAVALKQAFSPEFKEYQVQIVKNAKTLAQSFMNLGYELITNGTDNHLMLLDLYSSKKITGKDASFWLDKANITVNKNLIPYDPLPPTITSGIRIGTPAVTTRGMKENEMIKIAELINRVLSSKGNSKEIEIVKKEVRKLVEEFPLYNQILNSNV
jgi:glycine hydroxymethyltransferase